MNMIEQYGKQMTMEEYVREYMTMNRAGKSPCTKDEIREICISHEIKVKCNDTKTSMYDRLIEEGMDIDYFIKKYKIGVPGRIYYKRFHHLSPKVIRELGKRRLLHVVDLKMERVSGNRKITVLYYDIHEYVDMTDERMKELVGLISAVNVALKLLFTGRGTLGVRVPANKVSQPASGSSLKATFNEPDALL